MKKPVMILLLVILLCFTFSCRQGDDAAAEKETVPTVVVDNAISADGVSIAYEVRGDGEPALVFIHGWCCDRSYWIEQLSQFAARYKVVAIDLAGHGESGLDRKKWTIGAFAEDIVAVVDKLGLDKVVLIGHSMGGNVILEAGRRMPERVLGFVGVDSLHYFENKVPQETIDAFITGMHENFVQFMENLVRSMFLPDSDPGLIDRIVTDMSSSPQEAGIGAFEANTGFQNNELIQVLKEVKAPITCINSYRYQTNIETNRRYVPSFDAKFMPGVGHFNMIEDPQTFNLLLEETIQEFVQMAEKK